MDNVKQIHTLANLSNTIFAHYGAPVYHEPIPELLEAMKGHRKVAVFLFDALGKHIIELHRKECHFLEEHGFMTIESTNPATTVAATTCFLTGKTPIETGYMGWSVYLEERKVPLEVFTNKNEDTGEKLEPDNIMERLSPVKKMDEVLEGLGVKAKALYPYPVDKEGPATFDSQIALADRFFNNGGEFLYFYNTEPDHTMHLEGIHGKHLHMLLKRMMKAFKGFVKRHPDVLVISMADHGMVNVNLRDLNAYPDLSECLSAPLTLDARHASIRLKEGKEAYFLEHFPERFSEFRLISKEEILRTHHFGEGDSTPLSESFIGDYIALPMGHDALFNSATRPIHRFIGHHAGPLPEEMEILIGLYNK